MATNTKENKFETLIVNHLIRENKYELGTNDDYMVEYALDAGRLWRFLQATQEAKLRELNLLTDKIEQKKFIIRLSKKLSDDGIIQIIRNGFKYNHITFDMYMVRPSAGNAESEKLYNKNIFSVIRQLRYSSEHGRLALDFAIFLNGMPLMTFELKNSLTKQSTSDAVKQYKQDRDPKELIFRFKRCLVHFAVDDNTVMMCTRLAKEKSLFLPFNKGCNDGAGNPLNINGIRTDYLWKEILTKDEISNIIENFAQVIEEKDSQTDKSSFKQIFPRYHQLHVVKGLLGDALRDGVGARYLIQHSAGSGKSNSIAWLAHQLVGLKKNDKKIFDTIIVVTDRVNLDRQIKDTIKQFMQVSSTVGWAKSAGELRELMEQGKSIIITIVHKFQYILQDINSDFRSKRFAIIIDEAHSSQNGSLSAKMSIIVSGNAYDEDDDIEDKVNALIAGKHMAANASYFAFTATPKNKTLEMFGRQLTDEQGQEIINPEDGSVKSVPHYVYTMRQAIEEKFILDVLKNYTTANSYYRIIKTVSDDPQFDKKKAQKILRAYVEGQEFAINKKAAVMVEHFYNNVRAKIGGQARAMIVTSSIKRAIEYYHAVCKELAERGGRYKALVAFSGDADDNGRTVSEATLNGFPSNQIEEQFKKEPYRILVVANKFQTGYDEPLLHTMYVDKLLTDIKAVQTLSRLNRCYPGKNDTCVLDFINDTEDIKKAFNRYYKTTILQGETDCNKLNDLIDIMEPMQVYTKDEVARLVELYLNNAERDELDPILDVCAERYKELSLDNQIKFKSLAKNFVRAYNFLVAIMPYGSAEWEKLSIFLTLLSAKLPKPISDDDTYKIVEDVDLDSYRLVVREKIDIILENKNGEVDAVPVSAASGAAAVEKDTLSNIIAAFHDIWGGCKWNDEDAVKKQIMDLPDLVRQDEAYQNAMRNADAQNARDLSDKLTFNAILNNMASGMELYNAYQDDIRNADNQSFRSWLLDMVFNATYVPPEQMMR